MRGEIEKMKLVPENQAGFRKGMETINQMREREIKERLVCRMKDILRETRSRVRGKQSKG